MMSHIFPLIKMYIDRRDHNTYKIKDAYPIHGEQFTRYYSGVAVAELMQDPPGQIHASDVSDVQVVKLVQISTTFSTCI